MRQAAILFLLAFVPLGCFRPIKVMSRNQHAFDEPIQAHLITEPPPPTRTDKRVVAMPLDGPGLEACAARIALIDVDGLLLNQNMVGFGSVGDNPVALFKEKLDAAAADSGVCAVVLRINSPGGAVNASDVMYHELRRFRERARLPLVACVLDTAAGGAYLLAAACDHVIVHPTSVVGGVGVIWNGYNLRETLGLQSVVAQTVKAGPNIDMGSTLRLYSDSVRKLLEGMANDYHQHFKALVRERRPQVGEKLTLYGEENADALDGRVFAGIQAVPCGLADQLGYLDDAVARAQQLAGKPDARLLLFRRSDDPAYSPYAVTPNTPVQNTAIPFSVPGLDRTKLPTFLFMWLPEPTVERLTGS